MEVNAAPQAAHILPNLELADCQEHFSNLIADQVQDSWREFVNLPRERGAVFIVLDNFNDPVIETIQSVDLLGARLQGILIDTDSSRRGNIESIISEVAWHLRLMGRNDVKICLTGGVTPELIRGTRELVSSYGVGLSALLGPLFDFARQVVAVNGQPKAKIGVQPGKKTILLCRRCYRRLITLFGDDVECCSAPMISLVETPDPRRSRDLQLHREEIRQMVT